MGEIVENNLESLGEEQPLPEFIGRLEDKYLCPVCQNVLQQPLQTECGHRLCKACVLELCQKRAAPVRCPVNEVDCTDLSISANNLTVFPDHGAKREIKNLKVFCANRNNGCTEQMKWDQLEKHVQKCPVTPECTFCKQAVFGSSMKKHMDEECLKYLVKCQYGCKGIKLTREQLPDHLKICPLRPRPCRYNGCEFEGNKAKMDLHVVEPTSMAFHNQMLLEQGTNLQKNNEAVKSRLQAVTGEKTTIKEQF